MSKLISIEKAQYVEDYKISLLFNDGKENILDFKNFIIKSQHPDIKKISRFKTIQKIQFRIW